ncbi:MAG: hypothetical protein HRU38_04925 [Saccharospirillaceae bacterium]|nr:hypothetical protein [Pseudomonadales bacterium]NRB78000.1 hypothetical protein [Saccharospirillaceae bacterium]
MFKVIISMCLLSILTACVGIVTDFTVKERRGTVNIETGPLKTEAKWRNISKNDVLMDLGLPKIKTINSAGNERWVYPYKTAWKGIYLFVLVIPIPLKVPKGKLNMYVDFEAGNIKEISYEYLTGNFYACGPGIWFMTSVEESWDTMFCGKLDQ